LKGLNITEVCQS